MRTPMAAPMTMPITALMTAPVATYRLQLGGALDFAAATRLVPYLARLGVSHVYLSPILQAAAGSTHGYDVIDHHRVSADLGGEEAYLAFARTVATHGLKQMIDIVPNHMSIADPRNRWWWDVLEEGPASRYAAMFDVDWHPPEEKNRDVVLVPVLGDHRGLVLERGELRLLREGGRFVLGYMEHRFPVSPRSLSVVLRTTQQRLALKPMRDGMTSEERTRALHLLGFLADALEELPGVPLGSAARGSRRHRDRVVLVRMVESAIAELPEVAASVEEAMDGLNTDPDALDAFLALQNHRLAYWRTAERELDYRRFFDVSSLVGLKAEDELVFGETHGLVARLVRDGVVHGLRVDHIDGIADPKAYLQRLRALAPEAWIVVEKILAHGEQLREDWPVDGTTGYEVLNELLGLFVDPRAEVPLSCLYTEVTGRDQPFASVARERREQVLRDVLASEVDRVVQALAELCARARLHRDHTRHDLRAAVRALVAAFPVYRTYVRPAAHSAATHPVGSHTAPQVDGAWEVHDEDARAVAQAMHVALAVHPELDVRLMHFLLEVLVGRCHLEGAAEVVRRFQQLTGPAMAKGVEDTAFYDYARFLALNEVGGDPGVLSLSPDELHARHLLAASASPRRMNSTSTHDTKRSEDVRARLAILSEDPGWWAEAVRRFRALSARHRRGGLPDGELELFIIQTLVGAWPLSWDRLRSYLQKAMREAKTRTAWVRVDAVYEETVLDVAWACLEDPAWRAHLHAVVSRVRVPGLLCALAQLLLKLTIPGVPDIYQGTELWSFELVDPDNRRPVDFLRRAALLEEVEGMGPEDLMARMDDGLPKLALLSRTLRLRGRRPELFDARGSYAPLSVRGPDRDHVFAFVRGEGAITVVPRLAFLRGPAILDAMLALPPGSWRHVVSGDSFVGGDTAVAAILRRFPVALLEKVPS